MVDSFSQKEMLTLMMNKLDKIEDKLNQTHEQALATNGKVKLHTKIITGLGGGFIAMIGWIISIII